MSIIFVVFDVCGCKANMIELHWYDGDIELTVPVESQLCVYGEILIPTSTIPEKIGYTFKGWRVRQAPLYDFTTIPINENGSEIWAMGKKRCQLLHV